MQSSHFTTPSLAKSKPPSKSQSAFKTFKPPTNYAAQGFQLQSKAKMVAPGSYSVAKFNARGGIDFS